MMVRSSTFRRKSDEEDPHGLTFAADIPVVTTGDDEVWVTNYGGGAVSRIQQQMQILLVLVVSD